MQLWGLLLWLQAMGAVSIKQFFPAGCRSDPTGKMAVAPATGRGQWQQEPVFIQEIFFQNESEYT